MFKQQYTPIFWCMLLSIYYWVMSACLTNESQLKWNSCIFGGGGYFMTQILVWCKFPDYKTNLFSRPLTKIHIQNKCSYVILSENSSYPDLLCIPLKRHSTRSKCRCLAMNLFVNDTKWHSSINYLSAVNIAVWCRQMLVLGFKRNQYQVRATLQWLPAAGEALSPFWSSPPIHPFIWFTLLHHVAWAAWTGSVWDSAHYKTGPFCERFTFFWAWGALDKHITGEIQRSDSGESLRTVNQGRLNFALCFAVEDRYLQDPYCGGRRGLVSPT